MDPGRVIEGEHLSPSETDSSSSSVSSELHPSTSVTPGSNSAPAVSSPTGAGPTLPSAALAPLTSSPPANGVNPARHTEPQCTTLAGPWPPVNSLASLMMPHVTPQSCWITSLPRCCLAALPLEPHSWPQGSHHLRVYVLHTSPGQPWPPRPRMATLTCNSGCEMDYVSSFSPPQSIQVTAATVAQVAELVAVCSEGHYRSVMVDGRQSFLVIGRGDDGLSRENREDGRMKIVHCQEQTANPLSRLTRVSGDGQDVYANCAIVVIRFSTTCYLAVRPRCFEVLPNPRPSMPHVVMALSDAPTSNTVNMAVQQDGQGMLVALVEPGNETGEHGLLPLPSTSARADSTRSDSFSHEAEMD